MELLGRLNVDKKNKRKEVRLLPIKKQELYEIKGGQFTFSSALGSFVIEALNFVVDLGRYFGSALANAMRGRC